MAFTLLGTGTAVAKNINPKSDNTIVASAACNHVVGSSSYGPWQDNGQTWPALAVWRNHYKRPVKCTKCGQTLYWQKKYDEYTYGYTWWGEVTAEYLKTVFY